MRESWSTYYTGARVSQQYFFVGPIIALSSSHLGFFYWCSLTHSTSYPISLYSIDAEYDRCNRFDRPRTNGMY